MPLSILANDLQSVSDIPQEPRPQVRSQSAFREYHEQLSVIAALQFRLSELAPSPEQALDLIAQEALALTNAQGTAIALASGQAVVCCARAGHLGPPLGTPIDAQSGLSGECLRSGEVVCCDDTEADPRVDVKVCRQSGIRSVLAVPLSLDEQVIGVFEVFSARQEAFGYWEARLLYSLADLASEPRISAALPGHLSDIESYVPPVTRWESPPAVTNTNTLDSESHTEAFSSGQSGPARRRQVSKRLERIRQDPALRLLGRAKAYLTIEVLHDGTDRSDAIALCEELMFQRAAEIRVALTVTIS